MSNTLPKARRVGERPNRLMYILVGVIIALIIAVAVLLTTNVLASLEPRTDAERDYQILLDALKENPESPEVLLTLAEAEFELGAEEQAFEHADKAIEFGKDTPGLRMRYASLLVRAGEEKQARKLVVDEIALGTVGDAEPYFLLAQIDRSLGDDESALENMEKGLTIAPTAADMRIVHAEILAANGKKDEAIAEFQQALRFLPGDERAQEGLKRLGVTPPSTETTSPHGTDTAQ